LKTKKIVITGGPGTGKTAIINQLKSEGYYCFEEISRQIILEAQKEGIEQLFLTDPIIFSQKLLDGRALQFKEAETSTEAKVFLDRGIPDVLAYMDYLGTKYPEPFVEACKDFVYDKVFVLAPWKEIFISDNERYENFDQASKIHEYLVKTYKNYGYKVIDVPFGSIKDRAQYIINSIY